MTDWRKIKGSGSMPPGNWRRVSQLESVAGVRYRQDATRRFAEATFVAHADGAPFGLLLEREPSNTYDSNAIKVIGWASVQGSFLRSTRQLNEHIGYVDAIEAAGVAERYSSSAIAAEFYSLYCGTKGFLDVRYFIAVPKQATVENSASTRLLSLIKNELLVLIYAAKADEKLGRFEHDILGRYAEIRGQELEINLDRNDIRDMRRWCKENQPGPDEVEAAIDRLAEQTPDAHVGLWEMIEIILTIDGKVTKTEKEIASELARYISQAFKVDYARSA